MPSLTLQEISVVMGFAAHARSEDQLLGECIHWARSVTGVSGVDLMLVERQDAVLRATTIGPEFIGRLRVSKSVGILGGVLKSGERVVIKKNLAKHPLFQNYAGYGEDVYQAAVVEPLVAGKQTVGAIYFRQVEPWSPKVGELKRLAEVTSVLGQLIETYRNAYQRGTEASRRLGAVTQVADILSRSPYLEEILQLLVNLTAQQFNYRVVSVRLLDDSHQELVLRATQATMKAYQRKRAIKLGESIAGRAIAEQCTVTVADVQAEPDYIGHDLAVEQGLRSMICVPLMIQDRPVGVITGYTDHVRSFEQDEIRALETIARQAAVSIEHAQLQVRNTLMQEMHHRVKNNLQQVVSLLRLQLRHAHYKSIEQAINDSLSRILAIAAVHDLLSREDLDHVGLKSIAETLVQHQLQSFISPEKNITFEVRGHDIKLNMTQATQVALLINELIQNSVEHGFQVTNQGDVHVNIETKDDAVGIWVSNNGDALPPDFDLETQTHLGLQIVQNLAKTLGGTYRLEDRLGWTVNEILFSRQASE